jgi:hypothetical protein
MTTLSHENPPAPWWQLPAFWESMTISTMWLAVLFVGVFGPDLTTNDGTKIPSVLFVAFFAAFASKWVVRTFVGRSA